jgi:hypothetical protein
MRHDPSLIGRLALLDRQLRCGDGLAVLARLLWQAFSVGVAPLLFGSPSAPIPRKS